MFKMLSFLHLLSIAMIRIFAIEIRGTAAGFA